MERLKLLARWLSVGMLVAVLAACASTCDPHKVRPINDGIDDLGKYEIKNY